MLSEVGISSITPKGVWEATRGILSKLCHFLKSSSRKSTMPAMMLPTPSF
ncbi:Uncharacterised protein [Mycobacterium tuberculosis]|nr:Uncharacterised protein [Mycobacterium tuberculosis]